jgi:hypothetical protein
MSQNRDKENQESEEKSEAGGPVGQGTDDQSSLPLFLRNKSEGNRGDAQDEKDASGE